MDTDDNERIDINNEIQGVKEHNKNDGAVHTNVEDESIVEDVEDSESEEVDVQVEPTPRNRGRSGLRNIRNLVGSHRIRYEKEFQNDSKDIFERDFNYLT